MSVVFDWIKANPATAAGIFLYVLSNVAVKLTAKPQTAGVGAFLLWLCDLLAIVPHKDAKGIFGPVNLPLVPSKPIDAPMPTIGGPVAILVAIGLVGLSGCAWLKSTAPLVAGDVLHCATDGALAAIGPLVETLAEAALHGGEADWAAELAKLESSAYAFKDCVILAALNRVSTDPTHDPAPSAPLAMRWSKPSLVVEVHVTAQVDQAKMRLRAALNP